jgi:hypothetical protein
VVTPVNLEVLDAHLVSILLPTGVTLPSPLIILPDETPLYNEEELIAEFENAISEERPAKLDVTIEDLESFNSTLVTVTFSSDRLEHEYRLNIPRQYLQVGMMYNTILRSPAISLLTVSEMENYEGMNSLEMFSAIFSDEVTIRMFFPEDITEEQNQHFNYVLNHSTADLFGDTDVEELRGSAQQISFRVTEEEHNEMKAELVDIIISLINGDEDALMSLYEHAEYIDSAYKSIETSTPLNNDEKRAMLFLRLLSGLYTDTSPNLLVSMLIDTSEIDDINDFQHVINESGRDLNNIFRNVLEEHYEEHPEALVITDSSSEQERIDYLTRATNTIPLLGGLFTLSDRINVDLLYSRDWNNPDLNNDEEEINVSKGENAIILALIIAQRIQMSAKTANEKDQEAINIVAVSFLVESLTAEDEDEQWVLIEGLKRVAITQPLLFNKYLNFCVDDEDTEDKVSGLLGALMHRFGHIVMSEEWGQETMLIAFEKQPIIQDFINTMYEAYANNADGTNNEDDEDENPACFSTQAVAHVIETYEDTTKVIKQTGEALAILAELNVMRNADFTKGSEEWQEMVKEYLTAVAEGV